MPENASSSTDVRGRSHWRGIDLPSIWATNAPGPERSSAGVAGP